MKIPERQCMGCRLHKPKTELCRVVRSPDGAVSIDLKGKAQGRGVYLCPHSECFRRIRKSRALERALKTTIPGDVYEALEQSIGGVPPV